MEEKKMNPSNSKKNTKWEFEIDITDLLHKIWSMRILLIKAAVVGAIMGLVINISTPKQYAVSVTLAPEDGGRGSSGLAGMAASFFGGSIHQSGRDALNVLLAPQIVKSTPFLLEMLDVNVINPKADIDTTFSAYLDTESAPWWSYIKKAPGLVINGIKSLFVDKPLPLDSFLTKGPLILSKKDAGKIKFLRNNIFVNVEKKTSIITIGTILQDPIITATVTDSVVTKLQQYIVNYKISKAKDDCDYWEKLVKENREKYYTAQQKYAQYVDAHENVVYQSTGVERERLQNEMSLAYQVYSQVEQQFQMARAKVQESKPVFTILEPTVVPSLPMGMGKLQSMIIYAILIMLVTTIWQLFMKKYYIKFRSGYNSSSCDN